ncbi:replication termination factor [Arthroderma uncinatum]|uniref:replication termination factor n=1 Tax=Arthroderma uncinatum TaxID=74035 RepID=UPI00144AF07B|nr:replication termination factor [Arthroderma uncinatum]KAF3491122.1 replication termination factor [Arthroderma uncinatum]
MGNDGGSIPTRRELVKEAARNPNTTQLKETLREHLEHFWTTCPLSHKRLLHPIVSDAVGNLYNKDALLQYLLPGDDIEAISSKADCDEVLQGRVKSLRDVVELKFEADGNAEAPNGKQKGRWICPVTQKELGPNAKSVYLVPCGHVFSEGAIREMKADKCLQCNEPYESTDIISILPTDKSEKERLKLRVEELSHRGLAHSLKKLPGSSKKRKKNRMDANGDVENGIKSEPPSNGKVNGSSKTPILSSTSAPVGIKNADTAMLTARVLEEQNERRKRKKTSGTSDAVQSLFTSKNKKGGNNNMDFMTRGFSIPH